MFIFCTAFSSLYGSSTILYVALNMTLSCVEFAGVVHGQLVPGPRDQTAPTRTVGHLHYSSSL